MAIRSAQASDVTALSALAIKTYSEAFGHSFSEADLSDHLSRQLSPASFYEIIDREVVLLAEIEKQIVGYIQFGPVDSPEVDSPEVDSSESSPTDQVLHRLYIDAEFQNQGHGGLLMESALRHPLMRRAANIYLDVWEQNPGAQRFYRRYGFVVIGTQAFVKASGVSDGSDLLMVRRSLPG